MRKQLLLAGAAFAAYCGALLGSFHFDDYSLLSNPLITGTSGLWRMWAPLETRPLTNLTFWLNYQTGGTAAVGYHAVNLALHAGAVLLLYAGLRMLIAEPAALWAALLFAVHPIQSEAVAYIFARGTLLSAVFCFASLLVWMKGQRNFAIALFACALLSKEECVTFPLVLLSLSPRNRAHLRPIGVMLGLSLIAGLRATWATAQIAGSGAGYSSAVTPAQYFLVEGAALLRYLRLLIVPWGLTIEPTVTVLFPALYAAAWITVFAIAGAAIWALRRHQDWGAAVVAGFILFIPSSTIFPASDFAADRRVYLPMAAFCAAFGAITPRLPRSLPAALITAFTLLSIWRTDAWRTEEHLWREAVQQSPTHARPLLQLSRVVPDQEALDLLIQAKLLSPDDAAIHAELGRLWLKSGRYDSALQEFGRALALRPKDANALNNRGAALLAIRQSKAAQMDFERALRLDPCLTAARRNLAALGGVPPPCPATAK